MSGSRILITGSNGLIGTWLISTLLYANKKFSLGLSLTVVNRNRAKLVSDFGTRLIEVQQDLTQKSPTLVEEFEFVFLLANSVEAPKNSAMYQKISNSHLGILEQILEESRNSAPRIIHTSSGAIYGRSSLARECFKESYESSPESDDEYAKMKVKTETAINDMRKEFKFLTQSPRLFTFYGPGQPLDSHFAISQFMTKALSGEPVSLSGSPETMRSYMYLMDLITYLIRIAANPTNKPLNIGSRESISMFDLAHLVSTQFGTGEISNQEESYRQRPTYYWPCTNNLRSEYGDFPEVTLMGGLTRWTKWLA